MAFSIKQQEYLDQATHRWNIKSGATRSGKTYLDYFVIPKRLRAAKGKEGLSVILGNTRGTIQRNIIEPLQKIWGTKYVSCIRSDNTAYMFGEKVFCLGADKVNQVDRLRGSSIKYCYGDEVVTWHEDVFNMLKSRLDRDYSVFDGTCNPDNPGHWFKKFLESDADIYLQEYTIDDNPFLSEDFKDNLKKEYQGSVFYDRYIRGLWVIAEGLVYPMFDKKRHVIDECPEPQGEYFEYYISIDYGTINPCSMGLWRLERERAVRVQEVYFDSKKKKRQATDEEYYAMLEELAGDKLIECVVVDPSAASFIETIRRHGRFSVRKANNDVLDGIRITGTLLQNDKIFIHSSCENSIREFGVYRWDEKSNSDKVIKEFDHAMDDVRYACNTIFKKRLM